MRKTSRKETALYCDLCGEFIAQAKTPESLKFCRHSVFTGVSRFRMELPYYNNAGEQLGVEVKEIERKQGDLELCDKCATKLWAQADETRANLLRDKRAKVVY